MPATAKDSTARETTPEDDYAEGAAPQPDQPESRSRRRDASRQVTRDRLEAAGEDLRPPRERTADEGRGPRTRAQIFSEMDPQEWACRSQEHSWPQLLPGAARLPEGMRVSAAGRGDVLFEEDCLHGCGRYRETLTERGYVIVWRRYGTRKGHRHVVVHRDEAMSKAEMRQDTFASNRALIRQAVRDSRAAAAREAMPS